jgi:hypothetical protein
MEIEKYYFGYRLGADEGAAVSVLRVRGTSSHRVVTWATAPSRVGADVPYDAILQCLERLSVANVGPTAISVVRPEGALAGQALDRIVRAYSRLPGTCDPLPALAACAVFLAPPARPVSVVVADAGILLGAVDEAGLSIDLVIDTPATELESRGLPRGPWPLLAELEAAGARRGADRAPSLEILGADLLSTQQGLATGYTALWERLRAIHSAGNPEELSAASSWVRWIIERDLAVLDKTIRSKHPGRDVCVTGRVVPSGAAPRLSFDEQLALGAAVLSSWSELGTAFHEVHEAPTLPVRARSQAAPALDGRQPRSRIESFDELFPSREQRDAFLEQTWGRASAHIPAAIEPEALMTGNEFLCAIRRAHEENPAPAPNAEGISIVTVLQNGTIRVPLGGARPYPRQWEGALGSDWQAAHGLLAATERSGCESWDSSIRLASAHHVCPHLTPLVLSFFEFFASHCWVNAYYSPPRSVRGLACHADGTDVFVFQVEGEKNWVFDGAPIRSSAERHEYLNGVRSGATELTHQCVLRAGDLLYLPAGACHAALATTLPSLHLTFAVRRHTALRVRKWWARRSGRPEELNQGVQRFDPAQGRIRMNDAVVRQYLAVPAASPSELDLLEAYRTESLRIDREATLLGRLLANVDHV